MKDLDVNEYLIDPSKESVTFFMLDVTDEGDVNVHNSNCECGSLDHQIQYCYFGVDNIDHVTDDTRPSGQLYIQHFIGAEYTLWQRIKYALQFVVFKRPMMFSDSFVSGKSLHSLLGYMQRITNEEIKLSKKLEGTQNTQADTNKK